MINPTTALRLLIALTLGAAPACDDGGTSPTNDTTQTDTSPPDDTAQDTVIGDSSPPQDTQLPTDSTPPADSVATDSGPSDTAAGDTTDTSEPWEWPYPSETYSITPHASFKHDINVPEDPFLKPRQGFDGQEIRWIKFTVLTGDPTRVYFQDGNVYDFHSDFAIARLAPFQGMTRAQFDAVSLHTSGQKALMGAVLYAPSAATREFAIQLVGQDPYSRELVQAVFDLVRAHVHADPAADAWYFPTFEQQDVADAHRAWFEGEGIRVGSVARWIGRDACYANGWAVGRLVHVNAANLASAYADGSLTPADILLIDRVPAEVPPVAGIISLTPSTPNSHVAILAGSFGIPFVHFYDPDTAAGLAALDGKVVALSVDNNFGGSLGCDASVLDVDGAIDSETIAAILDLKAPAELIFPAKKSRGAISVSTTGLTSEAVATVGGKAANFGLLRAAIPDNSPPAIALTFDLWDAFMAQLVGGKALSAEIAERLAPFGTWPPTNMQSLLDALAGIRGLIVAGDFTTAQKSDVTAALAPFDADKKIRFRSSTNLEDVASFTGAGLYDSYSGCLADDLDGDEVGPSRCDANRANERGVFRAIKKVYASFYNDGAYLARLRHQVDESLLAMGVLVHHSFPDEIELANGVGTFHQRGHGASVRLVTQAGATSVANPDSAAQPEVVDVNIYSFGTYPEVVQSSSLVPLGDTVLPWEQGYLDLVALLESVAAAFAAPLPENANFILDFEYKRVVPDDLVVKQVRELPLPDNVTDVPVYLLPQVEPLRLCTFQGEYGSAIAAHRLKAIVLVASAGAWMDDDGLASTFFREVSVTSPVGATIATRAGDIGQLAGFVHSFTDDNVRDQWSAAATDDGRSFELETYVTRMVSPRRTPLHRLADLQLYLHLHHPSPVPDIDWQGPTTTTEDVVRLAECVHDVPAGPTDIAQERTITAGDVSIDIDFYWPPSPTGIVAGYTAPLAAWDKTTITGLTTAPIVLRGFWSQTYRPGHHNFSEEFVFEPRLEEGLAQALLTELAAADVVTIYADTSGDIKIIGADGKIRTVGGAARE